MSLPSISPSSSSREEGEVRDNSHKRRLEPGSAAARAPLPQASTYYIDKRFRGERDYRAPIRYADQKDWRAVALEEIDRRRDVVADNNILQRRVNHFENRVNELQHQASEADKRNKLLETQLREAQTAANAWQQTAGQKEE